MAQHIARCLAWVRAFFALRSTGRHRAVPGAGSLHPTSTVPVHSWDSPYFPSTRRRDMEEPVGGLEEPIFDDAPDLVRPYVVAAEQQKRQRVRLLATLEADEQGTYLPHGVEVA